MDLVHPQKKPPPPTNVDYVFFLHCTNYGIYHERRENMNGGLSQSKKNPGRLDFSRQPTPPVDLIHQFLYLP